MLGRRPDGYHDVETLLLALPWGDDVALDLEERSGVRLEVEGSVPVPGAEDNLAARAARAYLEAARQAGTPHGGGVRVRLRKRIPVGAGLGGGSSDAAAVLRGLQRRLGLLSPEGLHDVAAGLGADVPFFLAGGAAVGRGRGDLLEPLPAPPSLAVLLVLPGMAVDTARVYAEVERGRDAAPAEGLERAREALARGDAEGLRRAHHNALAPAAARAYPALGDLWAAVRARWGRPPALTGTGSGLFDVAESEEAALALAGRLADLPVRTLVLRT